MQRIPCRYITLSKSSIYRHRARAKALKLARQLRQSSPVDEELQASFDDIEMDGGDRESTEGDNSENEMEEDFSQSNSEGRDSINEFASEDSDVSDDIDNSSECRETDGFSDMSDCGSNGMEDNSDVSEGEDRDADAYDEPLYPGARITRGESMTCILKFYLRHNQSDSCLSEFLSMLELHCPEGNKCAKSLYFFRKMLGDQKIPLKRNFYCSECFTPLQNAKDVCAVCPDPKTTSYSISIPIESQLQELFERPGFYNSLNYRFERQKKNNCHYEDIYDGDVYRSMCCDKAPVDLRCQSNVSFIWNSDGVPLYKSSKFSIWPSYLMFGELSPEKRKQTNNMLLTNLWCGFQKPDANSFLEPLVEELERLKKGIRLHVRDLDENVTVKAIPLCATCDLIAKAVFLNMKQHNAQYGCHKCEIETVPVARKRTYQQTDNLKMRTTEETELFAGEALRKGHSVFGVKGPTVMSLILPDFIRNMTIDPMHLLMGIGKLLFKIWFLPEYRDHAASISDSSKTVSKRTCSIAPPSFVERLPRKIDDFAYWKASELIVWLLMYSIVILHGIMSEEYLSHHKLLIYGIYLLFQESVSLDDINRAHGFLYQYVSDYPRLYGVEFMTCNLHSLLHLAQLVRDYGPLWVFTCFPFENANGVLKLLVHATRDPQIQICKGVSLYLRLETLNRMYIRENSRSYSFYQKLEKKGTHRRKLRYLTRGRAIVGRAEKLKIIPRDIQYILIQFGYNQPSIYRFHCLLQNAIFYSAQSYTRKTKTNSSCVKYIKDDQNSIGIIKTFLRVSNCSCKEGVCAHCLESSETLAVVQKCNSRNPFTTSDPATIVDFIDQLEIADDEPPVLINVTQLKDVYFQIDIAETAESYAITSVRL